MDIKPADCKERSRILTLASAWKDTLSAVPETIVLAQRAFIRVMPINRALTPYRVAPVYAADNLA